MTIKIEQWTPDKAARELRKRIQEAMDSRRPLENQWKLNEAAVFNTRAGNFGPGIVSDGTNISRSDLRNEEAFDSQGNPPVNVNYVMRDVRFIQSQLSSNPPSVVPRPATADVADRRRADAADRCIRHGMRKYQLQEKFDNASLFTLVHGTSCSKSFHNPNKGDIMDYEESSGEITMEGDFDFYIPSIWNIFPEPAPKWDEVRYVFERFYLPWEEALMLVGQDKEEVLRKYIVQEEDESAGNNTTTRYLVGKRKGLVKIFQYWEKGLPYNGMQGRFCWCTQSGEILTPIMANPHRFKSFYNGKASPIRIARLPYNIWTDIDVPNTFWGQSIVSYSMELQNTINQVDNVTLDNLRAHGVARLILPEGCEVKDDSITNSPWDIVKTTGNRDPHFMEPMPLPPAINAFRAQMSQDIMEVDGVNENVFGKQSREQSGFSMQYATEQSNMIRRRLFNKYVGFVEAVYKDYLDVIVEHWDEPRIIQVLGKEKAFESVELKGSDIAGGYDLVVEYGTSLSLDPIMRRQELLQLMPVFEKAGVPTKTILSWFKLNELDKAFDLTTQAEERQKELFDEMNATKNYIAPRELQEHTGMLEFAYGYVMSAEYKYLDPVVQDLIDRHIKERETLKAQGATQGQPPAPAGAPAPAAPGPQDLMSLMGG
jgi:hypothetical protein